MGNISTREEYDGPPPKNENWMKMLSDEQSIANINIPGTHQTMSICGGPLTECQKWTLSEQYDAGIRFVDIRLRSTEEGLDLYHGIVYQKNNFEYVLKTTQEFLQAHPSEFIVMRIKEDLEPERGAGAFDEEVVKAISQYDEELFWKSRTLPTVQEARGKIVILQDFEGPELGNDFKSLDLEDNYRVYGLLCGVWQKWNFVKTHLEYAANNKGQALFLTFASGVGPLAYPNAVADRINPKLSFLLKQGPRFYGMIAMDFPGTKMPELIINSNQETK